MNGRATNHILELEVNNHPGVMSHICGLFARRAFNMEGIVCLPTGDPAISRIWLLVNERKRLAQVIRQTEKLHDVREVRRLGPDHKIFLRLEKLFTPDH
jgi:acetolactate synthase-1/3 small subunit